MRTLLTLILVVAPTAATAVWRPLPPPPVAPNAAVASVWTGKELLLFARRERRAADGAVLGRSNVAAAYDPAARRWRSLPSPGVTGSFLGYSAVWTGKEMVVWGQGTREAFDPRANRWRRLPGSALLSVHDGYGLVAWTGRELIGWGGGCCGDAFSDGVAYDPAKNRWRALARSPLAGSQHPIGAWTGRELIVLVGGFDPDGRRLPARLARAAAYDPETDTWRRIAPPPAQVSRGTAVWDGRELLVVGGARVLAYSPAQDRWRRLGRSGPVGPGLVWNGARLYDWAHSRTYDPTTDRWSRLPRAPVGARPDATAVWTGQALIVWSGMGAAFGE